MLCQYAWIMNIRTWALYLVRKSASSYWIQEMWNAFCRTPKSMFNWGGLLRQTKKGPHNTRWRLLFDQCLLILTFKVFWGCIRHKFGYWSHSWTSHLYFIGCNRREVKKWDTCVRVINDKSPVFYRKLNTSYKKKEEINTLHHRNPTMHHTCLVGKTRITVKAPPRQRNPNMSKTSIQSPFIFSTQHVFI